MSSSNAAKCEITDDASRVEKPVADSPDGAAAHDGEKLPQDPTEARRKKTRLRRVAYAGALVAVVAAVVVLQFLGGEAKKGSGATVEEQVISDTVQVGNVSKTLQSFGTIASASEETVSVPGSIKVVKYHVSKGDAVSKGNIIATVDQTTVLAAIADIQSLIDQLDAEVDELKNSSLDGTLTAGADGTVVAVYAQAGDEVVDVMYDHGALALVSLDGLLAVDVENGGGLTVGDALVVVGADGTTADASVSSIEKDSVTATMPVGSFAYDEKVTVKDSSGAKLGSGNVYVYSQQKITGYSGTVSSVSVSEGSSVIAGDTLLTLADTDYTADVQTLLKTREKLVKQSNRLAEISMTGYVKAEEDGMVSSLNEDIVVAASSVSSTRAAAAPATTSPTNESPENASVKTAATDAASDTDQKADGGSADDSAQDEQDVRLVSKTVNVIWLDSSGVVTSEGLPQSVTVALCAGASELEHATIGESDEWTATFDNLPETEDGKTVSYSISLKDSVEGFTMEKSASGNITTILMRKQADESGAGEKKESGASADSSASGESPSGKSESSASSSSSNASNSAASSNSKGNASNSGPASSAASESASSAASARKSGNSASPGGMSGASGASANANAAGASGQSQSGETLTEEGATIDDASSKTDPYAYDETDLCTFVPNDTVSVNISVDELDIHSIVVGSSVQVTLDALPGQRFEGKVSAIDPFGMNSGGNTKYTVTVSMSKNESMLLGMNASVGIDLAKLENVLLVPEAALVEQNGAAYIYTTYDEGADELGNMVKVDTGFADGSNVEITSGIEAGQPYYYRYAGTIEYTFKDPAA